MVTAAILNMHAAASEALAKKAAPMDTSGTSLSSGSSESATITANDFLTLLVTEMKNQDPTANTDPNEYINQLVQVNSLEQLIGINQALTNALGSPSDSANSGTASTESVQAAENPGRLAPATSGNAASASAAPTSFPTTYTGGNLGIPAASASALSVAHALSGTNSAPIPAVATAFR